MTGMLLRKLGRDLWAMRGQVLAIALVLGSGLAVLIMSLGAIRALEDSRAAFYDRSRFADVFAEVRRAPESLAAHLARIPGVQAVETRVRETALLDLPGLIEPGAAVVVSVPEDTRPVLNDLVLRAGRWPQRGASDEVLVGEAFAVAHGLRPGDSLTATLNGLRRTLVVVGVALSPEFVYTLPPGALMPDDTRYAVLWMGREALAAASGMEGAFNSVLLGLRRGADERAVLTAVDAALDRYGSTGAYARRDQPSDWFLSSEIEQLKTLGMILPTIFLGVSAFLIHMAANRLIALERPHIGLLKAFGFGPLQVGGHYLALMVAMALPGVLLGWGGGATLGRWITELYAEFFRFPYMIYRPQPSIFALAAVIGLGAAALGALAAVRTALALPPAEAMVPPAPPAYRRSWLRLIFPAVRLDQPSLMILRHITRWPGRAAMTTAGIALSCAVLVLSLQWTAAIEDLLDHQFFRENRHDATVTFTQARPVRGLEDLIHLPGVLRAEPFRTVPVRLRHGPVDHRDSLTGLVADPQLSRPLAADGSPLPPPPQGIMLSVTLAEKLGVTVGERLRVEVQDGRRPTLTLPVVALADTRIGLGAWMELNALNAALMEGPTISGAWLLLDPTQRAAFHARLKETPAVAGVMLRETAVGAFRETMAETMLIMVGFYVIFAGLLAFGVVYNSARVALSERARELASLRVLGFSQGEVAYILVGELLLLTLLALPLGAAGGWVLAHLSAQAMTTDLYRIPAVVPPAVMGWAAVAVGVAAVASALLVARRLRHLDLISVLKTRE